MDFLGIIWQFQSFHLISYGGLLGLTLHSSSNTSWCSSGIGLVSIFQDVFDDDLFINILQTISSSSCGILMNVSTGNFPKMNFRNPLMLESYYLSEKIS